MKKIISLAIYTLFLAGCLNTRNQKIEIHSKSAGGISDVNSGLVIQVNPKSIAELEMDYFENHSIKWPDKNGKPDGLFPHPLQKDEKLKSTSDAF